MRKAVVILDSISSRADRLATRIALAQSDFDVLTTGTLSRASELMDIFDVRVVVTDLDVTDSHGLATPMQLRQQADVSVVIRSEKVMQEPVKREAFDLGFEDIFGQYDEDMGQIIERIQCLMTVAEESTVSSMLVSENMPPQLSQLLKA